MMTPVCPRLLNMINGFVALLSSGPRGFKCYRSYSNYYSYCEIPCFQTVEASFSHSKLVEQLAQEQQKIQRDVERLEQLRSRQATPVCTPVGTPSLLSSSGSKVDLYRIALLLREANRIGQFLKKETVRHGRS